MVPKTIIFNIHINTIYFNSLYPLPGVTTKLFLNITH